MQHDVRSGPVVSELHFPYHPHVTVAHDLPEPQLDLAMAELAGYEAAFDADRFELFERDDDGYWHPGREFALGRRTGPPA